jgi:hypothetical protein
MIEMEEERRVEEEEEEEEEERGVGFRKETGGQNILRRMVQAFAEFNILIIPNILMNILYTPLQTLLPLPHAAL